MLEPKALLTADEVRASIGSRTGADRLTKGLGEASGASRERLVELGSCPLWQGTFDDHASAFLRPHPGMRLSELGRQHLHLPRGEF